MLNPLSLLPDNKPGDKVLYGKFDGMSIAYDGIPHVLIRDEDVLLTWQGPEMTVAAVQTVRDRILVKVKKAQVSVCVSRQEKKKTCDV